MRWAGTVSPTKRALQSLLVGRQLGTLVLGTHAHGEVDEDTLCSVEAASRFKEPIHLLVGGVGSSAVPEKSREALEGRVSSVITTAQDCGLDHGLAEPYAALLSSLHRKRDYSYIIGADNAFTASILPRAAAMFDVEPVTGVINILDQSTFVRPVFAGNIKSTVKHHGRGVRMLSIRPSSFSGRSDCVTDVPRQMEHHHLTKEDMETSLCGSLKDVFTNPLSTHLSFSKEEMELGEGRMPELSHARIVLAGGRALQSKENFDRLRRCAEKLGAAVGATRAAVDAGWAPNEIQIGQTGKIVASDTYVAFGISGAIQHVAGIRDCGTIIAINSDPEAPIFKVADYGLVEDVFNVLDRLERYCDTL
ncbi:hypothetical protein M9435_005469 [Picochlorum sp. BPE23]|nr:hypothetical protein M9435_005469 [Picochlorum sp. BPE23]